MKKVVINEKQKGLLFKNGKFVKLLDAGKYYLLGERQIERLALDEMLESENCALDTLLQNKQIAEQTSVIEVEDQQMALHYVNGKFVQVLKKGKYAFWTVFQKHEFRMVDISTPIVAQEIPTYIFETLDPELYIKIEVAEFEKARLYLNQKFTSILEPGTYYFWKTGTTVDVGYVDTRLTQLTITGQEILTKDKVTLRLNFVCNYRITDCVKVLVEIDDYQEQLHVAAQLALREYVGKYKLDEILENKEEASKAVLGQLKEKCRAFYVEIVDGGIKDVILPGEIREIMNTVLVAEKRAQANVITRREEVASTRSLLNTAKLMEENNTLYRLKELEYMERICENVGNINLNGSGDMLAQLTEILRGHTF